MKSQRQSSIKADWPPPGGETKMTTKETERPLIDLNPEPCVGVLPFRAVVALLLIEACVVVWVAFDHSTPCYDTAVHRLASMTICDLLHHAHCRSLEWYRSLFAVNSLYPPLFYFLSGSLKVIFGRLSCTDRIVNLMFVAIQFWAVYQAALLTCKSRTEALMAGIIVFLYPLTFWAAHNVLLDCGANAMVALGLCTFLWWSKGATASKSLLLGLVLGLAALTKSHTIAFFVGPVLVELVRTLKERSLWRFKQLGLTVLLSGSIVLPWLLLAGPTVFRFVADIQQQDFGIHNRVAECFDNLYRYSLIDPGGLLLSPLWFAVFVAGLLYAMRTLTPEKVYLIASLLVGILVCSSFRWVHQARYIAPISAITAILSADVLGQAWLSRKLLPRALCALVFGLAALQFLIMGFAPYPIQLPDWLEKLSKKSVVGYGQPRAVRGAMGVSFYPIPPQDWGMVWTLSTIERMSQGREQIIGALPNSDAFGSAPLTYLILSRGYSSPLIPCRKYTVGGDLVVFDPDFVTKAADWYVLKTGDQGREFVDQKSSIAYRRWCEFVRSSSQFYLFATKSLPDGGILQLYHNRKPAIRGVTSEDTH